MSRRIYCDLDNVLVDSVGRSEIEWAVVREAGIDVDWYIELGKQVLREKNLFSFKMIAERMRREDPSVPADLAERLNALLWDKRFIFWDTIPFLQSFPKDELFVLTEGDVDFQTPKVLANDIDKYINYPESFICQAGIPKFLAIELGAADQIFFLDDAPRHIDAVKAAKPSVVCIQLRTPPYWETKQTSEFADAHLPDLHTAAKFILDYD